jgi:hypothetical protein
MIGLLVLVGFVVAVEILYANRPARARTLRTSGQEASPRRLRPLTVHP